MFSPQNFLNESQVTTDTGDEICDNFTFQFTHHNNDNNGRGAKTEEKLYNVVRLEALERMSTKTERKWKFVALLIKSKFFIFSLKIPYSGLRNVIGFFSRNIFLNFHEIKKPSRAKMS